MRLFGLIGYPLSHSFSAQYFAKKFADENIDNACYQLFPIQDVSEILQLISNNPDLSGFNITIPHKISILPFLDHITEAANSVGAVNCVKIKRGPSKIQLTGYNTDTYGFKNSLIPMLKPYHKSALILGTGGAAKAVCYTLQQMGIEYMHVSRKGSMENTLNYNQLSKSVIGNNLLIINTTPVGMYPETDAFPEIPYEYLNNRHLLYDLVYNPAETMFMQMGRKEGATVMNGSQMLVLQAEKSWEIWNEA